ncbi:MAG: protein kinase [Myxococcaceae bacterium]|nr:protein kinase [Myxococcaceae bacterium]
MTSTAQPLVVADRYELESFLGRGGMGEVYRALDRETGSVVAVKRLRLKGGPSDRVNRARFRKEITLALTLEHPNIVRALDGGEDDEGLFLALEFLEGLELEDTLRLRGRFEWERAVRLAGPVCGALGYVHGRGILHRDVKAANVMLVREGQADERLVLIDFGIARNVYQATQLTSSGMLVGTAMYCAPEQIAGLLVDHRADLYAFGVVLFRMLTGQFPFEGPELPRVIYGHLHTPPPSVRLFSPAVPDGLEALVQRCLAKDPTARFPSATELERALGALFDQPPTLISEAPTRPEGPTLAPEQMLEFVDEERTFAPTAPTPFTDEQPTVLAPPRAGGLLLALERQASLELRALTVLSWASRLAPFFDAEDVTVRRLERLLERVLGNLVDERGSSAFAVVAAGITLNGQPLVAPLGTEDPAAVLARHWTSRGLEGLVLHRAPTSADVARLVAFLRTGNRAGLDQLVGVRIAFRVEPQRVAGAARSPTHAWREVTTGLGALIDSAARGAPLDGLEALRLADLVVAEAQRRGRRLLGVAGAFEGTANLAAQAANSAFTAAALALDFGLPLSRVRDVAHLAMATSVGMIQVYPLAFVSPEQLTEDERSLLRQTPVSVIRSVLSEAAFGPAVWRRVVLGYELATELSRDVEVPLGRGALPQLAPSLPTRLVFAAMTWWGLRSPLPHLPASGPDDIARLMRGVLRLRLDAVAVQGLERALVDAEEHPAVDLLPGADVALVGHTPEAGTLRKLVEPSEESLTQLAGLLQALVSTGLEPRGRILPLLLPVVDALLLQDALAPLNHFIRTLRTLGGDAEDSLEVNLARDLAHHLADDECVALMGEVLRDGPPKDPREFVRLLGLLQADEVASVVRLLDVVTHKGSRAVLVEAFAQLARRFSESFVALAREAPEARAVVLIDVLSRARDRQTMALVREQWGRVSARGRDRLLEACTRFGSADAMALLAQVAAGPDVTQRRAAIEALSRTPVSEATGVLVRLLSDPAAERPAVYRAIALRGDAAGLQALAAVAVEKPPLFQKARFVEDRGALVQALESVGGLAVLPLLSAMASDGKQLPEVRRAAEEAHARVKQALATPARP